MTEIVDTSQEKPKRKGHPKAGGRQKGTPNRYTLTLREKAQQYVDECLGCFVRVMQDPEAPHAAKVSAADKILDRGFGKPNQSITGAEGGAIRFENIDVNDPKQLSSRIKALLSEM